MWEGEGKGSEGRGKEVWGGKGREEGVGNREERERGLRSVIKFVADRVTKGSDVER